MNLIYRGKKTVAFYKLRESATAAGTVATRTSASYPSDDHKVLQNLLKTGLVEMRSSGPRGGSRYHATAKGVEALAQFEVTA